MFVESSRFPPLRCTKIRRRCAVINRSKVSSSVPEESRAPAGCTWDPGPPATVVSRPRLGVAPRLGAAWAIGIALPRISSPPTAIWIATVIIYLDARTRLKIPGWRLL